MCIMFQQCYKHFIFGTVKSEHTIEESEIGISKTYGGNKYSAVPIMFPEVPLGILETYRLS